MDIRLQRRDGTHDADIARNARAELELELELELRRRSGRKRRSSAVLPTRINRRSTQYQPLNLNVAIRIASPGNDGPVTQANLAINVGAPLMPRGVATAPPPPRVSDGVVSAEPAARTRRRNPSPPGPLLRTRRRRPSSRRSRRTRRFPGGAGLRCGGISGGGACGRFDAGGCFRFDRGAGEAIPSTRGETRRTELLHLRLVVSQSRVAPLMQAVKPGRPRSVISPRSRRSTASRCSPETPRPETPPPPPDARARLGVQFRGQASPYPGPPPRRSAAPWHARRRDGRTRSGRLVGAQLRAAGGRPLLVPVLRRCRATCGGCLVNPVRGVRPSAGKAWVGDPSPPSRAGARSARTTFGKEKDR